MTNLSNLKKLVFVLGLLFVFFPWHFSSADGISTSIAVKAPVILNESGLIYYYPGKITGLTKKNTEVIIYLDGNFIGNAKVQGQGTDTDNFYFQLPNIPVGKHQIFAVAKDKTSLVLSPVSNLLHFEVAPVPAPTLIKPSRETITATPKPLIVGLTANHTKVKVYIDGVFNGIVNSVHSLNKTVDFAYKPFLNLNVGNHRVWVVAEDMFGNKSNISNILLFNIEKQFPAPTLFEPVDNKNRLKQPFLVGLAKNDSTIRIFIDKKLNGEFKVQNDISGTANFAYLPYVPLSVGRHFVYAVSVDKRGKESKWSNIVYFNITSSPLNVQGPHISEMAVEENVVTNDNLSIDVENFLDLARKYKTNTDIDISGNQLLKIGKIINDYEDYGLSIEEKELLKNLYEEKTVNKKKKNTEKQEEGNKIDSDVDNLINASSSDTKGKTGLINENKEKQGKIHTNLVIFILFLFAVIIWIFWVNRELIKERREQEKENLKNKEKK